MFLGEVAFERLNQVKKIIWLIDSSAQIPALALGASTNFVFADSFLQLRNRGVRLFTTEKLFDETQEHFNFADKVIMYKSESSPDVYAAAMGQPPFRKSNQFLEGFIKWKSIGNAGDWKSYLFQIFGIRNPKKKDVRNSLLKKGIEIIDFYDWPGFSENDVNECKEYTEKIIDIKGKKLETHGIDPMD